MITNPLLYLLIQRLSDLRTPGFRPEDSDLEHQHLDRLLTERGPSDVFWRDVVLSAYVVLDRRDLAAIPTRVHHWFLDQLAFNSESPKTRDRFFTDLYDLLDAVGRFLIVRTLARSGASGSEALARCVGQVTAEDNSLGRQRTTALINLLLDVWLSESEALAATERERAGRMIPAWLRQAIRAGSFADDGAEASSILRKRGEALDKLTAEELRRLSDERGWRGEA